MSEDGSGIETEELESDQGDVWDKKLKYDDPASTAFRRHVKKAALVTPREESNTPISDLTQDAVKAEKNK